VKHLPRNDIDALDLGQSGDSVSLELLDGRIVVSKKSMTSESRLYQQYLKQVEFDHMSDFIVPRVCKPWDGSGFCMEYVSGKPLGQVLGNASITEVESIAKIIAAYLQNLIASSVRSIDPIDNNLAFKSKVKSMREALSSSRYELVQKALTILDLESIRVPQLIGPNHGDFSFENVLINQNSGEAWLVDFLDSPIETPLIDISRVLIDMEHGWWGSGLYPSASEKLSSIYMADVLRSTCYNNGIDPLEISFFKLFTAVRLVPYTKNPLRMSILIDLISQELRYISRGLR